MNLEIRQKYNNFIKIIEKKESGEIIDVKKSPTVAYNSEIFLLNSNDIILPAQDQTPLKKSDMKISSSLENLKNSKNSKNFKYLKGPDSSDSSTKSDKCKNGSQCDISEDYSSFDNPHTDSSSLSANLKTNSKTNSKTSSENNFENKSNYEKSNCSLLEENYIMPSNNLDDDINTIKSEFKHLFEIENTANKTKITNNKNQKVKNKLEKINNNNNPTNIENNLDKIYNKIISRKEKEPVSNTLKPNKYDLVNYIKKKSNSNSDELIRTLSEFIELNLFNESTRGWNFDANVYILNPTKLVDNLDKVVFLSTQYSSSNVNSHVNSHVNPHIKLGYIYRDYTNPSIWNEKDFTKNWVGYERSSKNQEPSQLIKYSTRNKILFYCFKNLVKANKFKKKIGKTTYKFIKKSVQIAGQSSLIIDIVFYVGISDDNM